MEQYAIVYFPNLNTKKIDSFRKKYDPYFSIIAPHITLVSPFSEISTDEIFNHVESVAKDIQTFQIHLQELIKTNDDLIFLSVKEGREEIVKIHNLLYSGTLVSLEQKYVFNPHITLGECNTENIQMAYAEAKAIDLDIYARFDNISLIRGDGISPAKTIKEFKLQ